MNPGYLSLIVMVMTGILLATGWKPVLLGDLSAAAIGLFCAAWLASCQFAVTVPGGIVIYICWFVLLLTSLSILTFRRRPSSSLHLLSVGLVLGFFAFYLRRVLAADPSLLLFSSDVDTYMYLSLVVLLFVRVAVEQIAAISIALMMEEALFLFFSHGVNGPFDRHAVWGGARFQDGWWLAVLLSLGWSALYRWVGGGWRLGAVSREYSRKWRRK